MYNIPSSCTFFDVANVKDQRPMLDVTMGKHYSSEISDAQLSFCQKLQDVKKLLVPDTCG